MPTYSAEEYDSLKLELEAEKHNHRKDNAYMVEVKHRLLDALEAIRKQAEPRDWETPGHPMNEWTKREPILRIVDEAIKDVSHGQV